MLAKLHNNRGLTFIELMVAMLIMVVTAAALYLMVNQGDKILVELEHERSVFEMAKRRLSIYKLMADKEAIEVGTVNGTELIKHKYSQFEEDDEQYILTADYTVTTEVEHDVLLKVMVEYTWFERTGEERRIKLVDSYPLEQDED